MRSRSLAGAAIVLVLCSAFVVSGCSKSQLPAPSVDNTNAVVATVAPVPYGIDTTISVSQLITKLEAQGLKVHESPTKKSGLFLPAEYHPMTIDGAFAQAYVFTSKGEARGAAGTVDAGGFILGATPSTSINVNWTGWPAYFRSGRMILIFVTEKGAKAHADRDNKVYQALVAVFGKPFMGGQTAAPGAPVKAGHTGSIASSATTVSSPPLQ